MMFETTHQQTHLNQCIIYINRSLSAALVQIMLSSAVKSLFITMIKALHQMTAMTVYMSNLLLNHYENLYV